MKKLLFLVTILCAFGVSFGQTPGYYTTNPMHLANPDGTAGGTLTNGDTGLAYIWVGQGYNCTFEMLAATATGTVATTSNILYGYNNNGRPLTAAQAATIGCGGTIVTGKTAKAITGNTTYCAGCVGASSTTVPGAALTYTWQVPKDAGALFDNYIIRTIQTGTATATYSAKVSTE